MRYEDIKDWKEQDFKRLTSAKHEAFQKMLVVLERELPSFGRPTKLSRADQLPMTLMYWREYHTRFHIADFYGISEATVCRTINKVEARWCARVSSAIQREQDCHGLSSALSGRCRLPGFS